MLVIVVDDDRATTGVAGLRMQADIARGVDLIYSVEGPVELAGKRYTLHATLIALGQADDEVEAPPAGGP